MEEGGGNGGIEMFGQPLHDRTIHEPVYSLENAGEYPSRTRSITPAQRAGVKLLIQFRD